MAVSGRGRLAHLPADVCEWLHAQKDHSSLPGEDDLLVETFSRGIRDPV